MRLSIGVIAIVLATTLGLTTTALFFVKRNMQDSIAQEQFARISALADAIDQKFISRRSLLRTFSASVQQQHFRESADLQAFLMAHEKPLRESFDNVSFLNLKGDLIANLNNAALNGKANIADRDYFIDTLAKQSGVISKPFVNRFSGLPQIALTQPVMDEKGAVRWVISGAINLKEENFLGELARIKFGKTGYMFITNTDGVVIDHPRKNRILQHTDAEGGRNEATARAIAGFEGTTDAVNRVGVHGLYAFKQTKQTNWVLGSIYPKLEAFEAIDRIERLAWAGAILLTLLAGGLALAVMNSQLAPLTRLHEHMQNSREVDAYEPYDESPSQPEIRDMARTFDALMLERERVQTELQAREARVSDFLAHAPDAFVSCGQDGDITEWNRQAEATFGWTKEEVLGKNLGAVLIPLGMRAAHDAGFARFIRTGTGPVVDRRIEVFALHKDGHEIPVELSVAAVRQGDYYVANAFLRDITDRKRAQAELAASEKRARDISNHVPASIAYFDADLRMHFVNEPARQLFQLEVGKDYDMRSAIGEPTFLQHVPYLDRVLAGEKVTFEFQSLKIEDSYRQANLVPDIGEHGEVKGFYVMTFDVTDLKRAEKRLLELARLDTLTQLPNRRRFSEKLDEALARSKRSGRAMGLMYLDIDYFKQINDTYGHGVGDEVLIGFARRLQAAVRTTDTVARLSGDEFVIILEGLNDPEEASVVASKIVVAMQEPLALQEKELRVTSSIGVAVIEAIEPDHDSAFVRLNALTATELIARADQALYEAKGAGRNRFAVLDA